MISIIIIDNKIEKDGAAMYKIYSMEDGYLKETDELKEDVWINMQQPTMDESCKIANYYKIDFDDIIAALDDEESSRISVEDNYTIILVDVPINETRNEKRAYTTIPLEIILLDNSVITICAEETSVIHAFTNKIIRDFTVKKKMRFIYQIIYRAALEYQSCLRNIDRRRTVIEEKAVKKETDEGDLIELHELESNLVYFETSLNANRVVLDKMVRNSRIKQYQEDMELLEDVIIENSQAVEMANIYKDIIHGSRDLISTIINNQLNDTMKYLTIITVVMAIPTVISGLYGMNVDTGGMPFAHTDTGFGIITFLIMCICILALIFMKKRRIW